MTTFNLQDTTMASGSKDGTAALEKKTTENAQVEGDASLGSNGGVSNVEKAKSEGGKVVEIYLKGPLSHAYTEILNTLLGRKEGSSKGMRMESTQQTLYLNGAMDIAEDIERDKSLVYVFDGKTMNLGDLTDLSDAIIDAQSKKDRSTVSAVVEHADVFMDKHPGSGALDHVLRMARRGGGEVFFSQTGWLRSLGF